MENKNLQSSISIDIDVKELVRAISYTGNDKAFIRNIDFLKDIFLDQHLDHVLNEKSDGDLKMDILLGVLRKKIYEFRSNHTELSLKNKNSVDYTLCRCLSKSLDDIRTIYHEHKGQKKKILLESQISGICGHCKPDFEMFYSVLESEKGYIEGEPAEVWIAKVEELINEFYYVCPAEFSNLKFKVIKMDSFNLKLRCDRGESIISRNVITETLSNFFTSELDIDLKLSVVI